MKKNIGKFDRIIRFVIGFGLLIWGYMTMNPIGLLGLVVLATATLRWCPAYLPFRFNSCKYDGKPQS